MADLKERRRACVLPPNVSRCRRRAGRKAWSSICRMHGAMAPAQSAITAARSVRLLRQDSRCTIEFNEWRSDSDRWRMGSLDLSALVFSRAVGHRQDGAAAARDPRASVLKKLLAW